MLCRQIFPALSIAALAFMLTSPAHAEDKVLKVGTLKLIHTITPYFYEKFAPAGYKIEVIPFETPTDAKNAVAEVDLPRRLERQCSHESVLFDFRE